MYSSSVDKGPRIARRSLRALAARRGDRAMAPSGAVGPHLGEHFRSAGTSPGHVGAGWNKPGAACPRLDAVPSEAGSLRGTSHRDGPCGAREGRRSRRVLDLDRDRTNRLYGAARLILRDDALAEDVVQDALLRAWQDLRGLRDPERFDAWLQRVLVRTCYRAAKRHRLRATARAPDGRPARGSTGGYRGFARHPRSARPGLSAPDPRSARRDRPSPLPRPFARRGRGGPRDPARHDAIPPIPRAPADAGRPRGRRARNDCEGRDLMQPDDRFPGTVADWLEAEARGPAPEWLHEAAMASAVRVRQRPAWAVRLGGWWAGGPPEAVVRRQRGAPPRRRPRRPDPRAHRGRCDRGPAGRAKPDPERVDPRRP